MKKKVSIKDFVSPVHYSVFILQLPKLKPTELKKAAQYKIKNLYPGNINDIEIFVKKNGTKKNSYIILAVEKNYVSEKALLPFIYLLNKQNKINQLSVFVCDEYIEAVQFEGKALKTYSSVLLNEEKSTEEQMNDLLNNQNNYELIDLRNDNTILIDTGISSVSHMFKENRFSKLFYCVIFFIMMIFVFAGIQLLTIRKNNTDKNQIEIQKKLIEEKNRIAKRNTVRI